MGDKDTNIGGSARVFPSTCWSRFLGSAGREPAALEELARRYWKPVYTFIRIRWAKSNEEAKDLTQEFFVWMLEGDFLAKADPGRGRFRSFMKIALEHYLCSDQEKRGRQKRGGGREFVPAGAALDVADAGAQSPAQALDLAWKHELLLQATAALEEQLRHEGKDLCFRIFRDGYVRQTVDVNYRDMAARYGISEAEVLNQVRYARKRCRDIVTGLVAETVQGEEELREEMRALFGEELR